jgi:hypothetical protein
LLPSPGLGASQAFFVVAASEYTPQLPFQLLVRLPSSKSSSRKEAGIGVPVGEGEGVPVQVGVPAYKVAVALGVGVANTLLSVISYMVPERAGRVSVKLAPLKLGAVAAVTVAEKTPKR